MEGSAVEEIVVKEDMEAIVATADELEVEEMTELGRTGEDVGDAT